jgi:serine/threonine protein phosphatase PrpC
VLGCVRGRDLWVANIGDSRAILGGVAAGGRAISRAVSADHKPDLPAEKARIERAGGRVFAVEYDDGEEAPPRVWLATADIPGLAMSRSLGDVVAHSVGVTSEPEMHHLLIPAEMTWLIFASDGLWEFMSNDEVVAMTAKAPSVGKAIDALITEATDRWMRKEQIVDDTTVVIVEFESAKK